MRAARHRPARLADRARPGPRRPARDRFIDGDRRRRLHARRSSSSPRGRSRPVSIQQLAIWGLRGITTLDADADPCARGWRGYAAGRGGTCCSSAQAPAEDNADGWGALAADLAAAAWAASPTIQAQGSQAVITSFFDELFNHLDPYSRYVAPQAADEDRARRDRRGRRRPGRSRNARGLHRPERQRGRPRGRRPESPPATRIVAVDDQPTRGEDLDTRRWAGSAGWKAPTSR